MKSTEALDTVAVARGLIEVLLVPTRFSAAWERVAAAETERSTGLPVSKRGYPLRAAATSGCVSP
ncbi:hypothetical protein [Mycobacterium triplex]|uniref:hypothetical protein n=1 Tax=Mycobacterium triplex TaxID=47839 RepID=UPI00111BD430|nr:hypothetical protein [Mycobacterium triplex]